MKTEIASTEAARAAWDAWVAADAATDPAYYQGIAQKALDEIERNKP